MARNQAERNTQMTQKQINQATPIISRRQLLASAAGIAALAGVRSTLAQEITRIVKNGRINQSVSRWCYGKIPLDKFCDICAQLGLKGIDLLQPDELPAAKKAGLVCTMLFRTA